MTTADLPLREKALAAIFEAVRECVLDEGGDGEGWILGPDWLALADAFERNEAGRHFTTRGGRDASITFAHQQEFVGFGPGLDGVPPYSGVTVFL